ncbi:hypothetical protein [uncultured Eudoraea sp.]|uniref:hypothetical protein n=1 Tax=uncultured Eudoraea sp. TaxID=1035614 RepID=UPI00260B00CA|nr:hypothetical protein [uncultured Eudoraea sp.]
MKNYIPYTVIFFVGLLLSCSEAPKKDSYLVHALASPVGNNSALPHLFSNGDKVFLSWVEKSGDSLASLYYAEMKDDVWQAPNKITEGTDWFVNWADYPMLFENQGNFISHVLQKSAPETFAYDIKLNVRPKGATNWSANLPLHKDGTPTEHGFVAAVPYKDNSFFMTWLDGRNTLEKEDMPRGPMTLRAAIVSEKGEVSQNTLLDSRTCDCCQTTAAITSNGAVVLYRDRSEEEIRDISIVRQVEGKWTAPKPIHADNWRIKGCPVNGPKVAALDNNLAVAWFTAAGEQGKVKLAFSADGGANFDPPIRVDEANAIGRVDVVLLDAEIAIVSWMEADETGAQLKAVKIDRSGKLSNVKGIAEMHGSRSSGFPQMELAGGKVYFSWTHVTEDKTKVKTAYLEVSQF